MPSRVQSKPSYMAIKCISPGLGYTFPSLSVILFFEGLEFLNTIMFTRPISSSLHTVQRPSIGTAMSGSHLNEQTLYERSLGTLNAM
jgi:hypothetical protein